MTKKLEKINKSTCLKLFEKKDMATMNQFLCIRKTIMANVTLKNARTIF